MMQRAANTPCRPKTLFQIEWMCSWDCLGYGKLGEVGCHVRLSVEVTPFKTQANLSGVVWLLA